MRQKKNTACHVVTEKSQVLTLETKSKKKPASINNYTIDIFVYVEHLPFQYVTAVKG